jgi:signal peptidase I
MPVSSGDRILVLKTIFQFVEPNRWDVVVFKTPFAPRINYIKRLLGRPGEKLQIIDGDVYINGKIARKPPKIQEELWMPVYNNDYQPVQPEEGNFNGHAWRQPFENTSGSTWKLATSSDPTCFSLESAKDQVNTLIYNSAVGNDFRAAYSYNQPASYQFLPNVSDLRLSFYADINANAGMIGIALSKYQVTYKASVEPNGLMLITSSQDGKPETVLARKKIEKLPTGPFVPVNFANVDHMLVFNVGENQLVRDMGRDSNSIGNPDDIEPGARILASGKVSLNHISLDRDIYYTGNSIGPGGRKEKLPRGTEPVILGKDDFFMLGDNSPSSFDSRYWESYGIGNNDKHYRRI